MFISAGIVRRFYIFLLNDIHDELLTYTVNMATDEFMLSRVQNTQLIRTGSSAADRARTQEYDLKGVGVEVSRPEDNKLSW